MKLSLRGLMGIVAAGVIASAAAASAQTTDSITNVPFAFAVGNKTLPRDVYRISRLPGHLDVVQISGLRGGVIVMSQPDGPVARTRARGWSSIVTATATSSARSACPATWAWLCPRRASSVTPPRRSPAMRHPRS